MSFNPLDPSAPAEDSMEATELDVEQIAAIDASDIVPAIREEDAEPVDEARGVPAAVTPLRRISGRYRSCPRFWELELRVDVDGFRPMRRVSGDYYRLSGATKTYFGSFVVNKPRIRIISGSVVIEGVATMTWSSTFNRLRVTIPRHNALQPPATATALWMNAQRRRGASYSCLWESSFFRTVELEQDQEEGVTPFSSYNTGTLPSGGPARTLTVGRAYAETGVELRETGRTNTVEANGTWSNAELHLAMENHFSRWRDQPQWKVWLFHAKQHDIGPGLLGIMFDQKGLQRQGCAVFYNRIGGNAPTRLRDQLYTCVHELGHCFNLFHSFHKTFMTPPLPNRPLALSWMNYPWRYPNGGAGGFWSRFPFQFDSLEVIHLRHAFRNNIIMGGNPFGRGAAREGFEEFDDPIGDRSGLRLELSAQPVQSLGAPVHVNLALAALDNRRHEVSSHLDPKFGYVQLVIQTPDGRVLPFEHPIEHCVKHTPFELTPEAPKAIPACAYIGYDREAGQVFQQPGAYQLRAAYAAEDGSIVLSNIAPVHIRRPVNAEEAELADLMLSDDVGMLMALDGSDSPQFARANEALDTVISKHSKHPVASFACLVKGRNIGRPFKTVSGDNQVTIRQAQHGEAQDLLRRAVDEPGLGDLMRMEALRDLGRSQAGSGNTQGASQTKRKLTDLGKKKELPQAFVKALKSEIRS